MAEALLYILPRDWLPMPPRLAVSWYDPVPTPDPPVTSLRCGWADNDAAEVVLKVLLLRVVVDTALEFINVARDRAALVDAETCIVLFAAAAADDDDDNRIEAEPRRWNVGRA